MHHHHLHRHHHAHSSCEHHEHHNRHGHPCVRADHPFGGGGRRERVVGSGGLQVGVLHLVAQKPVHGYEIIKADTNGRKEYATTADGTQQLAAQQAEVERVLTHIGHLKSRANARRVPEIVRAMENLKTALRLRLGDEVPDPSLARRIAEIIDRAAVDIERIEQ